VKDINECIQQYLSAWHRRVDDNEYVNAGITGLSAAEILEMFEHPALRLPEHKHAGVSLMVDPWQKTTQCISMPFMAQCMAVKIFGVGSFP